MCSFCFSTQLIMSSKAFARKKSALVFRCKNNNRGKNFNAWAYLYIQNGNVEGVKKERTKTSPTFTLLFIKRAWKSLSTTTQTEHVYAGGVMKFCKRLNVCNARWSFRAARRALGWTRHRDAAADVCRQFEWGKHVHSHTLMVVMIVTDTGVSRAVFGA